MWTSDCKFIDSNNVSQIRIFQSDRQITYSEVIQLWQQDRSFRIFFSSLLAESPYEAYFWETPPINQTTVNRGFEFVLVNSSSLAKIKADSHSFQQYFNSTEAIVNFANLRGDALLVVPRPIVNPSIYPHIASFMRNAPEHQQHLLWQTLGNQIEQKLGVEPMWVSTSGLGVYWLHIRLDSFPKYYFFQPYKKELL